MSGLESTVASHPTIGVRRTPRPTHVTDNIENVVMRRSKAVDDPVAAAKSVYDTIHSSLETAATTLKDCVDRLQSAAPLRCQSWRKTASASGGASWTLRYVAS
jgi:hypothetical protein